MLSIIVAFPNIDDANRIKGLLVRYGYEVVLTTNNAAQVINMVNKLDDGMVLCGYKLKDVHYHELYCELPKNFSMILMASVNKISECYNDSIICVPMPLKTVELVRALEYAAELYRKRHKKEKKPKVKSEQDIKIINEAKELLMNVHGMSEEEAHRYIQKISMDSGNSMRETAEMVLLLK